MFSRGVARLAWGLPLKVTCNRGITTKRSGLGIPAGSLQLCGLHCLSPWGDLYCSSPTWEHTECLSWGPHMLLATVQWFFSNACVGLDSGPPRGTARGSLTPLHPRGSTACALFCPKHRIWPHEDSLCSAATKLNRAHSPSSAPFISEDCWAHNTLHSSVLCC